MVSQGRYRVILAVIFIALAMVFPSSVIESGNVEVHQIIDTGPGHAAEGFNVHLTCQQNVSTIKPGSSFTYHINVSNTGPVADTIVLTIENPTDWQAHFNNNPAGFSSESEEPKPRASSYRNYSSCIAEILALEAAHPDIVNVTVIGTSWEGRAIPCIKVSDNVTVDEDEPEVLFMGLHHAREWMTVEVPMFFLNHLVDNYGSDPRATWTVKNRETYIVPIVNPDGYVYSQEVQNMWRKNRRDNGDGTWGVDLNRNYDINFGGVGSSSDYCDDTYHGPSAHSEPEIAGYVSFVGDHEFVTNLQYFPREAECDFMMKNLPVEIAGDPSEKFEVSNVNLKDLPRIETNRLRSGYCLIHSSCIPLKATPTPPM